MATSATAMRVIKFETTTIKLALSWPEPLTALVDYSLDPALPHCG
jgi:hypothetical protein